MSFLGKKNHNLNDYADQLFTLLQKNLSEAVDNFVDNKFPSIKNGIMVWRPHIDLKETNKAYILKADIPGVEKKDIKVEINDDVLTISGERTSETKKTKDKYHWTERFHGHFSRSFSLPNDVIDQKKIDAEFHNGVITVTLKKKSQSKSTVKKNGKNIEIK